MDEGGAIQVDRGRTSIRKSIREVGVDIRRREK